MMTITAGGIMIGSNNDSNSNDDNDDALKQEICQMAMSPLLWSLTQTIPCAAKLENRSRSVTVNGSGQSAS